MNYIYGKKYGLEIVPLHEGKAPVGFQVNKSTGEEVALFTSLSLAEEYLDRQGSVFGKGITVGSAAEVRGY